VTDGSKEEAGSRTPRGPRIAVLLALVLAAVGIGFVLTGGDPYTVNARFIAATQVVEGGLVQAGGRPVGKVGAIELTEDGQADVELRLDDDFAPVPVGTEARVRLSSLSSGSGRYIELLPPPTRGDATRPTLDDGGLIPAVNTTSAVDLDQFFNLFDKRTRKGLQDVYRGFADYYRGRGREQNESWRFLNPSLVASERLFRELDYDTPKLERFLVESAGLFSTLADRDTELSALVDDLATTTGALAREETNLSTSIRRLPPFMRRANTTFVNLRATLDDVAPLVRESLPVAPKLRRTLAELRPFAREAVPTVRNLATLVKRPGGENDLIDLAESVGPLRDQAVRDVTRNGARRPGSFPASTASLRGQMPILQQFRPYAVDFTGWLDDFSHSGIYDANGSASRSATSANAFASSRARSCRSRPPCARRSSRRSSARGRTRAARARSSAPSTARTPTCPPACPATRPSCPRGTDAVRRLSALVLVLVVSGLALLSTGAGDTESTQGARYVVELDNAFGLVEGADVKVAGVRAGKIASLDIDQRSDAYRALVAIEITQDGFGELREDVFCESRPQSLIGEYFVDCLPGKAKRKLPEGAGSRWSRRARPCPSISSTTSCAARSASGFSIIFNELGAGLAGRAEDLNETIRRANPALRETDKVLAQLARERRRSPTSTATPTSCSAAWRQQGGRGAASSEARDTQQAYAAEADSLKAQFQRLPTFLRELRPTLQELGRTVDRQTPALRNLDVAAGDLVTFLDTLGPFADSSRPAVRTLARAARQGRTTVEGARPQVRRLRRAARQLPRSGRTSRSRSSTSTTRRTRWRRIRGRPAAGRATRPGGAAALRLPPIADHEPRRCQRPPAEGLGLPGQPLRGLRRRDVGQGEDTRSLRRAARPEPAWNQQPRPDRDPDGGGHAGRASRQGLARGPPGPRGALHRARAGARRARARPAGRRGPLQGPGRRPRRGRAARRGPRDAAGAQGRREPSGLPDGDRMKRRSQASIVANPVLVGAVTTLIVTIAVFLAYNANNGLPFVPTTQLKIQVSNGANLLPGNEIREGGERIGVVSDMRALRLPDGTVGAEATLKIDEKAGEIPTDSRISLRPKSVLGLKYVELTRGKASTTFTDGEVLPAKQTGFPVDLEEFYRIYDEPTRAAIRRNLRGGGDALKPAGGRDQRGDRGAPAALARPRARRPDAGRRRDEPPALLLRARRRHTGARAGRRPLRQPVLGGRRRLRGLVARPGGAAGDDPQGPADPRRRHPLLPRAAPLLRDTARLAGALEAGRCGAARHAAADHPGAADRHPGQPPHPAGQPRARKDAWPRLTAWSATR
jgi:phospholipid/cholesterol/gamma-HCH transport system substrate-binding protein